MRVSFGRRLFVFSLLFSSGMWMSKVAQPLWFERQDALENFAVGYAAMAAAGGASFLFGRLVDRLGGATTVRIGALLYAVGIAGRISTHLIPVVGFSILAGVGASLVLVSLRSWMRSALVTEDETAGVVATRSLGNQLGIVVGTLGAAVLFSLGSTTGRGESTALLMAAGIAFLGAVWLFIGKEALEATTGGRVVSKDTGQSMSSRRNVLRASARLCVVAAVSGFYVSLVTPYLPVVLTKGGLTPAVASIVVGVMSAVQIVVTTILGKWKKPLRSRRGFAVAEGLTGVATLVGMAVLGIDGRVVAVVFIVRASFVAAAVIFEELLQLAAVPAGMAGVVFAASQSAFLVGDIAGGAVGAALLAAGGAALMLLVSGVITIVNALVAPILLGVSPRSRQEATP